MNDSIQINILKQKINLLEIKIDSITQNSTLKQIQFELNEKQDIISQVNDFYDSAWLKLIIVISVLGIIVPIIVQFLQRKNLNDLTESIRKQMNDSFESKLKELKEFNEREMNLITQEFKNNINLVEKQNENLLTELDASTFYLQGRAAVNSKNNSLAIQSFLKSAHLWSRTRRPERAKVMLVNLTSCLKNIKKKSSVENINKQLIDSSLSMTLNEYIEYFENNENIDLFKTEFNLFKKEIERIKLSEE
ncbi:hypothetical protein Q4553_13525 [Tenacibaculum soleae]|uniref:hypothetical protein n=1 Tax=Tenacibaculum soleae TaxID=447689 RepID=UPI0026E18FF6|nr:hypothetical protein [Tenacibaculum soleae]MDO6745584.1 hypothetical protein [Tenacibaculum soleae]